MIISEKVEVTISNQGKYYSSLGYKDTKQGTKIIVPIEHLLKNSNIKVECQCDQCDSIFWRQYQLVRKEGKLNLGLLCFDCARKEIGVQSDKTNAKIANSKRTGVKHPRWNPNKSEFVKFANQVRWLSEKKYIEYKDIINPHDYPRTLCGVEGGYQLDHIISIKRGFLTGLNPEFLAEVNNLRMVPWKVNRDKWY
jgi:hypothetical protein